MPIRIAHISDTHLGTRPRDGVKQNVWAVEMRARLIENDFYERFTQLFEMISHLDPPVDAVVHSGDLYDSPWEGNAMQPPVVAQETALSVMKSFIEKTGIPVVIIEGNHGLYRSLDVSLLDTLKISIPGLQVATQVDLRRALMSGTPLKFSYEKFDIFCFPFIEESILQSGNLVSRFNDWITTFQRPNAKTPAIAVAHGMDLDRTLFPSVFSMNYDYIALGHDHHQHKHSEKAWYAGSPEYWRFDEVRHKKGFLVVDIEKNKPPKVTPHHIEFKRPVHTETFAISGDDSLESLVERVRNWLDEMKLRSEWDTETSARVRIVFEGTSARISRLDLSVAMESLKLDVLGSGSIYNVAQLVWSTRKLGSEQREAAYPEVISEYLIEEPESDFRQYLETLKIDERYDPSQLTAIAVKSLKLAVCRDGSKMSLDTFTEDEPS